ncbi:O-antigen ligase family protein [Neobacillus sp. PS2-9]|uniref:O-antigen ligase family protein n=1 Tax=Neobacillus sp. PS2-9 TaxID=3070676 RepID=UPI0027E08ADC|nr:O-antigen ligase family protein [Neobacillus sp. PS2-9]WML59039.1 O-antigen ligase family protein [Neobacillus sp. PS2-9]
MNLLQRNLSILFIGILAVIVGLVVTNSKLALLISVFIALLSFWKKENGILFLLIFIPLRPFLIAVNPGFKVIGDAIIGLLLIRTIWDSRKELRKLFTFHPFELAFFAFAVIGVLSALITDVSLKAIIVQFRAYFLFYLVYYIVKRMDITSVMIRRMSYTTFFLAVIMSIQGIVEKISNKTALMPQEWQEWWLSPTNRIRVYGLLKGPNELSLYLLIAIIISLYLLKQVHGKARSFLYVGMTLMGTTMLLTYSRGTLLTLFAFLVIYLIVNRKWRPFVKLSIVAIVSIGLFFGVNQAADLYYNHYLTGEDQEGYGKDSDNGSKRYKNAFSEETIGQSSSSGRLYYVKKAVEIFKDHPIVGTGFGTFGGAATLAYSSPIYDDYGIESNFYSDNQYILVLAETGILGTLALILVSYFLLVATWKNRKKFYGPLLSYLFIALIVGGAVYNILENDTFMMFYFILLGIVLNKQINKEPDSFI